MNPWARKGSSDQSLQLFQILVVEIQRWEIASLAALRPHKDTIVASALEIPLPFDRAVILTRRLVQHNADPRSDTRDFRDGTQVLDGAATGVGVGEETNAAVQFETYCCCEKSQSWLFYYSLIFGMRFLRFQSRNLIIVVSK